jgi:hypothetical protein
VLLLTSLSSRPNPGAGYSFPSGRTLDLRHVSLYVVPIRLCPHALQPRCHVRIGTEVDLEYRPNAFESRANGKIDDAELPENMLLAGELDVEDGQKPLQRSLGFGHYARIDAEPAEERLELRSYTKRSKAGSRCAVHQNSH